jgi:hypothetical protein
LQLLALLVGLVPVRAFAHPGHGHTDPDSWRHYLTEPIHILVLVAVVSIVLVSWLGYRRRRAPRPIK